MKNQHNTYSNTDGSSIRAGEFIDTGTAFLAPFVVGSVFTTPKPILSVVPRGELITQADRALSAEELAFANKMVAENRKVTAKADVNIQNVKNPDFEIDGEIVEFKYVSNLAGTTADAYQRVSLQEFLRAEARRRKSL